MNKKSFFYIIIVLIVIIASVSLIISIINHKPRKEVTASNSNTEISSYEFEINEVEVIDEDDETVEEFLIPNYNLTPGKYYIKVNNEMNTVTIYIQDQDGNYTIPVKAMICSTGDETFKDSTYKLPGSRWEWRQLFGNVYGQYTTHIYGNILFHSVPYINNHDPASLEYWEYDKLGTTASAGCVRLKVEDAKWIYDNCLQGSIVEFYSSSDPGPLGKPSVDPISEYEEYRNWDPTDPNERNPWKNFKEK